MPQFIFATAFDQYAVKAFEVNAVDYLLKPFDKKRVSQAVEKVRARKRGAEAGTPAERIETLVKLLEQQKPGQKTSKVMIRSAGRLMLVDQKDICFASIQDGVISVFTSQMEGQSNCRTLEELLEGLDPNQFWRAHRGFVVKSSYQLRMDDKKQTEVPVSRAQTKRLRELFGL
jgi:two-component system, LytTR family, response regulator LytT